MYGLRPLSRGRILPRFADDFFREFWNWPAMDWPFGSFGFRVDIKDAGDHYLLQAELPGVNRGDINLEVVGEYLVIGVKSDQTYNEEEENRYVRRERRMMSCERQFYVGDVNPDEIDASYNNGVLEVKIPKKDQVRSNRRSINIK